MKKRRIIPVKRDIDPPRRKRQVPDQERPHLIDRDTRQERSRSRSVFRMADISRAIRAAQKAGVTVGGVDIHTDGAIRISIVTNEGSASCTSASAFEVWKDRL